MQPEQPAIEPPIGEDDLQALVDGVLDPARAPAVQRYLAERPDEAARLRAITRQRDALRAALVFKAAEPIPARLRIGHLRAARRAAARARWRVAAAAACLVLAGAGLGWTVRGTVAPEPVPVAGPSVPAALHLAEAPARQEALARETDLGDWLHDRLGKPMAVPDLAGHGFLPDLARVLPDEGGPAAMLRYVDADGIVLSIWRRPTRDPVPRPLLCADEPGGLVTYSWSDGRHQHAVTAALPRDRLRPIALAVERAMEAPPAAPSGLMAGRTRRPCDTALG